MKRYLISILVICFAGLLAGCSLFKSQGQNPQGDDLTRLEQLPNYKNGSFENLAQLADSTIKQKLLFLHGRRESVRPSYGLPWVRTDLKTLSTTDAPAVVWFGHSSLLIKTVKANILIDPIFSSYAGPVPGVVNAFKGTNHYQARDMPPIDVLIISHDHYDHLDYRTLKSLKNNIKMAIVPMGVGSDLVHWGFDPKKIIELNWNQSVTLPGDLQITATPAQHKSNRSYSNQNKTLWASYVMQAGKYKLFYSGDSGYGKHFKEIGDKYGPFDLASLECGQYSPNWAWTHLLLEQPAQAAIDLKARMLQPIHWAKFPEANHPWNEPIEKLLPAAKKFGVDVTVPRIGEVYEVGMAGKTKVWWDFE